MRIACAALLLSLAACKPTLSSAEPAQDAGSVDLSDSKALLAEVDRMKDKLEGKPKTFEVLAALGNLYYENGRYLDAVDTYRQAEELAAPAEAARKELIAKGVKPAAELPAECRRAGSDYGLAEILEAAKKLEPARELRCLDGALEQALQVHARRGNGFYLIGNADAALKEHRGVLAESPDYPESLFFVGAILLEQSQGDKKLLEEGKKSWRRLLEVAPEHPRAEMVREMLPKADEMFTPKQNGQLPAGHPGVAQQDGALPAGHPAIAQQGQDALPPGHPALDQGAPAMAAGQQPMSHAGPTAEEVANMADAVQGTERTPELEKGLDALLDKGEAALDRGDYQEARDDVVRVMPMRPTDARAAAELGGAMRGLGRTEMAQRTLGRALQLDPKQPRALFEMARLQAAQNDAAGARQSLTQLQQVAPKFAEQHAVAAELAKLH